MKNSVKKLGKRLDKGSILSFHVVVVRSRASMPTHSHLLVNSSNSAPSAAFSRLRQAVGKGVDTLCLRHFLNSAIFSEIQLCDEQISRGTHSRLLVNSSSSAPSAAFSRLRHGVSKGVDRLWLRHFLNSAIFSEVQSDDEQTPGSTARMLLSKCFKIDCFYRVFCSLKNLLRTVCILFSSGFFVSYAGAQPVGTLVTTPVRRSQILEQGNRCIAGPAATLDQTIARLSTPFLFPEAIIGAGGGLGDQPNYDQAAVIRAIAQSIRPQGVLIDEQKQWLYLPQGRLAVGDSFYASVQGASYQVTLAALTNQDFTLRLGATIFTQPINTLNSSKIHFDNIR